MARPQFHALEVIDIRAETPHAKSVAFAVPDDLADDLKFIQGQYLTLRAMIDGEELRRPYSLCVAPSSGEWRICVKKDKLGRFSGYVNDDLKVGDKVDVMGRAMGRFYAPVEPEKTKTYVMMAGGSGITPVMSNIRTILEQEPKSKIILLYGNRTRRDIIFREAFNDLKNIHMERLSVYHVLSDEAPESDILHGMMTGDKVTELVNAFCSALEGDYYFICGPGPMMDGAKEALLALGVDEKRIKIESFGNRPVVERPAESAAPEVVAQEARATSTLEVIVDGTRSTLEIPRDVDNILDFVLDQNIDAPFSCKSGICSTCRAKLIEGKVDMGEVHGLEPDEIEAGYILTCSAKPASDKIVIEYEG